MKLKVQISIFSLLVFSLISNGQATYVWNGASGDFQIASNWNPTRTAPATNDVLSIAGAAITISNVPTQTIGRLIIAGTGAKTLQPVTAASSVSFSILGGTSPNLFLSTQSLTFSTTGVNAFNITSDDANISTGFTLTLNNNVALSVTGVTTLSGSLSQTTGFATLNNVLFNGGTLGAGTGSARVNGNIDMINAGNISSGNITVLGFTNIPVSRTLTIANNAGNKIFNGNVSVSGTWAGGTNSNVFFNAPLSNLGAFNQNTSNYAFNSNLNNSGAFTTGASSVSFTGTNTSITGTTALTITNSIFNGSVTNSNTGLILTNTTIAGSLTNQSTATFTTASITGTFTNNGTATLTTANTSGNIVNNATLTSATALIGSGTLTQGVNAIFILNHNLFSLSNFNAINIGNIVRYNLNGVQSVFATTYQNLEILQGNTKTLLGNTPVLGYLNIAAGTLETVANTLSVTGITTVTGILNINNAAGIANLNNVVFNGGTLNGVANSNINVTGNADAIIGNATFGSGNINISGTTNVATGRTLALNNATGTKSFLGNTTIAGVYNASAALTNVLFGANLIYNGTAFTSNTGVYTFSGANASINGTNPFTITNAIVTGTVSNNVAGLTITSPIINGSFTNNAILSATSAFVSGTFTNIGTATVTNSTANSGGNINNNGQYLALTAIGGLGTFTQGINANLTIAGTTGTISTSLLNLSATGNNIFFNQTGAANIPATAYFNVILNNAGTRSLIGDATIFGDLSVNSGSTLTLPTPAKNLTLQGDLTGAGTLNISAAAHTLNLNGVNNNINTFIAGTTSTVNYIRSGNQNIGIYNYNSLDFPFGNGTKQIAGTTSIAQNLVIPSGVTFNINPGATFRLANNNVINNQGIINLIGNTTTGFATIRNNGTGNYSIVQSTLGAAFNAQYYLLSNLGNGGLRITDGSINNISDNFSYGSFGGGIGAQYLFLSGLDFADFTAYNVTFTGGPTFNVTRTTGNGVISFSDAAGTFSGSAFTSPVPTDLVLWDNPGNTYFSQATGLFNDVNNWRNSASQIPTGADFTSGLASFTVRNNHVIALNRDLDIFNLQVGEGSSGELNFDNSINRRLTLRQLLNVRNGASFTLNNTGFASHTIDMRGNINTNNTGYIFLSGGGGVNADIAFNSPYTQILGNSTPTFSNVFINTVGGSNIYLKANIGIVVLGNFTINNNSTFDGGNFTHQIGGDWTRGLTNADYVYTTTGTINFNGTGLQTINSSTTFNNILFTGGSTALINANLNIASNFNITGGTTVNSSGTRTINISGNFNSASGSFVDATGIVNFIGTTTSQNINGSNSSFNDINFNNASTKNINSDISCRDLAFNLNTTIVGIDRSISIGRNFVQNGVCQLSGNINMSGGNISSANSTFNIGTSNLNIATGTVTFITAGSTTFNSFGNININSGQFVFNNNTTTNGLITGNTFQVANGARVFIRGTNNFPINFSTYNLGLTSFARYDLNGNQNISTESNGVPIVYGNLELISQKKSITTPALTVTGNLDFVNGTFTLLDLGTSDWSHFIAGNVNNFTNSTILGTNSTNGTVTFNAQDANQTLNIGTYLFRNVAFTNSAPTAARTKTIFSNIVVLGNLTATNLGGNSSLPLNLVLGANQIITSSTTSQINLGSDVILQSSIASPNLFYAGHLSNNIVLSSLSSINLNLTTTNIDQLIPSLDFGNLILSGPGGNPNPLTFNNKIATFGGINVRGNFTTANRPIFIDGGFTHTISGNWALNSAQYSPTSTTSTIILNGNNNGQTVGPVNSNIVFQNLVINNTGGAGNPVTILPVNNGAPLTIFGDLSIINNGSLATSTKPINIHGNWINTAIGTSFQQTGSTITFVSTVTGIQLISSNINSFFNNLTINNPAANTTVTAISDLVINGSIDLINSNSLVSRANFDISGRRIAIAGSLSKRPGTRLIFNTLTGVAFNGNIGQAINNGSTEPFLHNVTFSGSGTKTLGNGGNPNGNGGTYNNIHIYTGNIVHQAGSQLALQGLNLQVEGNWTGLGSLNPNPTGTISLTGVNQILIGTNFFNLVFANSGTKSLGSNIDINGSITIQNGVTLDISPANYQVGFGANWTNDGTFVERLGTVFLTGAASTINTRASYPNTIVGKQFYNFVVAKTANATMNGDLVVRNDVNINSGGLNFGATTFSGYVGREFQNTGGVYSQNNPIGSLYLINTVSGNYTFDPGTGASIYGNIFLNTPNSIYSLTNDLTISNQSRVSIVNGTLSLAGKSFSSNANGASTIVSITGGTFDVSAGSQVLLSNSNSIVNNGGRLRFVGSQSQPATTGRFVGATTGFTITQTGGVFEARNYNFQNLGIGAASSGITFLNGTIDGFNNFSNGSFNNATAGTLAFLNFDQYTFPTSMSISGTAFNAGATNNVRKNNSIGGGNFLSFTNSSGSSSGAGFELDVPNGGATTGNFRWTRAGKFWDNGSGDNLWHTASNWSDDVVPTQNDTVYIDHSFVLGAYEISVAGANASAFRLVIDKQGTTLPGIGVVLSNPSSTLNVIEHLNILNGTTLAGANPNNIVRVGRNWQNDGTFLAGNGTVVLNGSITGTNTLSPGISSFNNLVITAPGSSYLLTGTITSNNLTINEGTLNVSASNFGVYLSGNYFVNGTGSFIPRAGTVFFNGANQTIGGASFNTISIAGTGTKTIVSNPNIASNFFISPNTTVDGLANSIFINGNFTNNSAINAFRQNTGGKVWFLGTAGTQLISNGTSPTQFAELNLGGAALKNLGSNITLTGDLNINTGSGNVGLSTFTGVALSPSQIFTNNSANTLIIQGENNFPSGFGSYIFGATSIVDYRADINQTITGITYGNLIVSGNSNTTLPGLVTKTALGNIVAQGNINIGRGIASDPFIRLDVATNNSDITLGGNLSVPTGGQQIAWGSNSTLLHNGAAWNIDVDITNFNNLVLAGTGTKTMLAPLTISGNVQVTNSTTFTLGQNPIVGLNSRTFTLSSGSQLNTAIPTSTGVALPTGFGTRTYATGSTVNLNGNTPNGQSILPNTFGNLTINAQNAGTPIPVQLLGNLTVQNNFNSFGNSILTDNGFGIEVAGNLDIRNYPSPSNSSFIFLTGADQTLTNNINQNLNLPNIRTSGSGTKTLTTNNGGNIISILGNVLVNTNTALTVNRTMHFDGQSFRNLGTYTQTQTLLIKGETPQTLNLGNTNTINNATINNTTAGVLFTGAGGNFNGIFSINAGSNVNMGNGLTHNIAGSLFQGGPPALPTINGNWTTSSSNFVFDGGGQSIPNLVANNVSLTGTGTKAMIGNWHVNNLYILLGVTLNTNAGNTTPNPQNNTLTVLGNFINDGAFAANQGLVVFAGNAPNLSIQSNGATFYDVDMYPSVNSTYTFISPINRINRTWNVGCNATVLLNSRTLNLGGNLASGKNYNIFGKLHVNENATLAFSNQGSQSVMSVTGSCAVLSVIGSNSGNLASVSVQAGAAGAGSIIRIDNGATIASKYYQFSNLSDLGLMVTSTANVSPIHNFSDGSFLNQRVGGLGARYYLFVDADATNIPTITGVNFNYVGNPIIGTNYNIGRSTTATGALFFDFPLGGVMGVYNYEFDPANEATIVGANTGKIQWPLTQTFTWIGSVSSNWHNGANWSPTSVPGLFDNVIIRTGTPNNASILSSNAECRDMTIQTGSLNIDNGNSITLSGSLFLGTANNTTSISVNNPLTTITMFGSWTKNAPSIFSPGGGTVLFNCNAGTYDISPGTSAFNNLVFNNSPVTYRLNGPTININGNLRIDKNATLTPSTNNYFINLNGNYLRTIGANLSSSLAIGTIVLRGGNQTIEGARFFNLSVAGTGSKFFIGADTINGTLNVNSRMIADATCTHLLNGDVNIRAGALFDDGGQTHNFFGTNWTGVGSYTGIGTVNFIRNGSQNINGGTFNNLNLISPAGNIAFNADISTTGDVLINKAPGGIIFMNTSTIRNSNNLASFSVTAAQDIRISGANSGIKNYSSYSFNPTSITRYNVSFPQTISGINYGTLSLEGTSAYKTLGGDIGVGGTLLFGTSTLDITANNYSINVAGDWNNNGTGNFIANLGQVIFDGPNAGIQRIFNGSVGTKTFNNIIIDRASIVNDLRFENNFGNNRLTGDLIIQNGQFNTANNVTVGGSLLAINGNIIGGGTLNLAKNGGAANIRTNGSVLPNLNINAPNATYTLQDNLDMTGSLNLLAGTFNGNGNTVAIAGATNNIFGTYRIGSGGRLALGTVAFIVDPIGSLEAVGTSINPATVTRRLAGNIYNLQIGGYFSVQNYAFEYMNSGGIQLLNSATVDGVNNLSNGIFTNGVNNGIYLEINNSQTLTATGVTFANSLGAGYNVSKPTNNGGIVTFDNFAGAYGGESFDNDPNDQINWTGPILLTWKGTISSDWFNSANWEASSGPNIVPTGVENVIIAKTGSFNPIINHPSFVARTKSLTINTPNILTINSPNNTVVGLSIDGDILIDGTLVSSSNNDLIVVAGNWTRNGSGALNLSAGTVSFTGASKSINNNNSNAFNNVVIGNTASILLSGTINVNGNVNIFGTLNGSSSIINAARDFVNLGNFISGVNPLNLRPIVSSAGYNFTPGSSNYTALNIFSNSATIPVTYNLGSDFNTSGNIILENLTTFNVNNRTFNFGNGTGSPQFTVSNGAVLNVNGTSTLNMSNTAGLTINSGSRLSLVGISDLALSTIKRQTAGRYGVSINNGGTIAARYYLIEGLNASGLLLSNTAILNTTNNFSDGSFTNGTGNRYLSLNNVMSNTTISNVNFGDGPSFNVERTLTSVSGIVTFFESIGSLSNSFYEKDDEFPAQNPSSGSIQWIYLNPLAYWTGDINSDWHNSSNWLNNNVPDENTNTFILDVTTASSNFPVISGIAARTRNLTLNTNALLTLNGVNLSITGGFFSPASGSFVVSNLGNPTIKVGSIWQNSGTFSPASSTVELNAALGTVSIVNANSRFNNLVLNSSAGGANFQTTSNLTVTGNLNIQSGTFTIGSNTQTISIGNNLVNQSGFISNGGSLLFNRASGVQSILGTGISIGNISIAATGTKTLFLASNLTVNGNFNIAGSNTFFNTGPNNVFISGNWTSTARTLISNGTVILNGVSTQIINRSGGENFNNLIATGGGLKLLNRDININGNLTLINGLIETGSNKVSINSLGTITGGNSTSYIVGNLQKAINTGSDITIPFEVGNGNYLPVSLNFPNIITGGTITARVNDLDSPNISSCLDATRSVNKHWSINGMGVAPLIYNATFNFIASNYDIVTNPLILEVGKYLNGNWAILQNVTRTALNTRADGITTYGDFQLAQGGALSGLTATVTGPSSSLVCQESLLSFTVNGNNLGATPTYQWRINATSTGTNNAILNTTLAGNNTIFAVITSTGACYFGLVVTSSGLNVQTVSGIWTGTSNTNWFNPANWCSNSLPANGSDIFLQSGSTFYPTISAAGVSFNNLTILGGASLSVASNNTVSVSGNWFNSGTFTSNSSTVVLSGTAPQIIGGTSNSGFFNLNIANLAGVSLASGATVRGTLSLRNNTTLNSGGNLILASSASESARVATLPAGATITGNVTVQNYMGGKVNARYMSFPVQNAPISQLQSSIWVTGSGSGFDLPAFLPTVYTYDEAVAGSINIGKTRAISTAQTFTTGLGYEVLVRSRSLPSNETRAATTMSPVTLSVSGLLNQGNIAIPVSYTNTGNTTADGWNLIGNPYPSQVDWDAPSGWTKLNINNSVYFLDPGSSLTTVTSSLAQSYTYVPGTGCIPSGAGCNGFISQGQGFYIKANAVNPVLAATEAVKTPNLSKRYFREESAQNFDIIRVAVKATNGLLDETLVRLGSGFTDGYDNGNDDVIKFQNSNLNLSTRSKEGYSLVMNSIALGTANEKEVALEFVSKIAGQYDLNITAVSLSANMPEVFLRNKQLKTETLVTGFGAFSFNFDPADTTMKNNYALVLRKSSASDTTTTKDTSKTTEVTTATGGNQTKDSTNTASLTAAASKNVAVYPNPLMGSELVVEAEGLCDLLIHINIFDVWGQKVYANTKPGTYSANQLIIKDLDLKPGTYLMSLSFKDGNVYSKKVVKL